MTKPPNEMTAVELLHEFCENGSRARTLALAREKGQWSDKHQSWALYLGHTVLEVVPPRPEAEARWEALCAEINTRFGGPR